MATKKTNSDGWRDEEDNSYADQQAQERKRRKRLLPDSKSYSNGDFKHQQESENQLDQFLDDPKRSEE